MNPTTESLLETIKLIGDHGSLFAAAKATGIPRTTLQNRLKVALVTFPGALVQTASGWGRPAAGEASGVRLDIRGLPIVRVQAAPPPLPPPQPPAPPADPIEMRRAADTIAQLRRRVKDLEAVVIYEQDWRTKVEGLQTATTEPVQWLAAPHVAKANILTPVLFTSDFQCGEVIRSHEIDGINEYNCDIFAERYQRMIDKTIMLATHNTGATEFPGCIYLRGGDAISGEIHDELAETNDLSSIPAVRLVQRMELEGIRRLKAKFGRVRVISVPGNHGRTTFKSHAKGYVERNYETMLSWWLASMFDDDPNVTFWTPPSGEALFDVAGWNWLMSHGDRIGARGGTGFIGPAANIVKGHRRLYDNWTMTGRKVDLILTGHLHTSLKLQLGYANGSLAGYGEFARDIRATPDAAKQWLLFAHAREHVSHAFELVLSERPLRTSIEYQV